MGLAEEHVVYLVPCWHFIGDFGGQCFSSCQKITFFGNVKPFDSTRSYLFNLVFAYFFVFSFLAVFIFVISFLCWVLVLVDLYFVCLVASL